MKKAEKIFIAAGIIVIISISCGLYVNNKINHLLDNVGGLGVILADQEKKQIDNKGRSQSSQESKTGDTPFTIRQLDPSASDLVFDEDIEMIIQNKLNKPIERKDKIKVALILLRGLSIDDITYFYDLITLGTYTSEDISRARAILALNLSNEDQETLRELAQKYGIKL